MFVPRRAVWLLLIAACTDKTERPAAKAPAAPAATVVVPAQPKSPAQAALPEGDGIDGAPDVVSFLRDGSLLVATDKEVVVVDGAGKLHRAVTGGRAVKIDPTVAGEGVVLEGSSELVLLDTPSLRELYRGPGTALSRPAEAIDVHGAVLVPIGGKLVRFTLPAGKEKRGDTVELVNGDELAVVTWMLEDTMEAEAAVFDVATGRLIGRALPMPLFAMQPIAVVAGTRQIGIDKGSVVAIDLTSAAVVKTSKLACPKGSFLGNPMAIDGGDLVLVTCGADGITLDARTFAQKRRIPRIIPGCDNGEILPAHLDPKAKGVLVVEGCGGEARLDLGTGVYRCSDEIGLVGAEYEMVPGGPGRRAPPGRENVPRCTKEDEAANMRIGTSGTYAFAYGEVPSIVHAGGTILLEEGAGAPALSPDEKKVAYAVSDRVIVRSLPSGAIVKEIARR